jgi:hypothetical protein
LRNIKATFSKVEDPKLSNKIRNSPHLYLFTRRAERLDRYWEETKHNFEEFEKKAMQTPQQTMRFLNLQKLSSQGPLSEEGTREYLTLFKHFFPKAFSRLFNECANNPHIGLRARHLTNLTGGQAWEHPIIVELLKKGNRRLADLGEKTKFYYSVGQLLGIRLREFGAFLAAANTRSRAKTQDICNACFILCLRDHNRLTLMGQTIEKLNVDKQFLEAVDLFFRLRANIGGID